MVKILVALAVTGAIGALFAYLIDRVERRQDPKRRAKRLAYLKWAQRHRALGWKFKKDPFYQRID